MDEDKTQTVETSQREADTSVRKYFFIVTPLSKFLAMSLFVILPFLGFWLGVQYAERTDVSQNSNQSSPIRPETDNRVSRIIGCDELLYEDSIDSCYFQYAQSGNDIGLCGYILDENEKKQCRDYLTKNDEDYEKLVVYTLSSSPGEIAVGSVEGVFFSISYAGTLDVANILVEEVSLDGNVVREVGMLNDNGEDGDLSSGDFSYGGTFRVGPYDKEGRYWYRAVLEFPTDDSKNTISKPFGLMVTRFPLGTSNRNMDKLILDPVSGGQMVSNEILVGFVDEVSPDRIEEIVKTVDGKVIGGIYSLGMYQIELSTNDAEGIYSAIKILAAYPEVEFAEPNGILTFDDPQ